MTFWILHSSYGRPALAYRAAIDTLMKAKGGHKVRYLVGIQPNDPKCKEYFDTLPHDFPIELYCLETNTCIENVNLLGKMVRGEGCILVMSDDFVLPDGWDVTLEQAIGNRPDLQGDYVVDVFDGFQPSMMTFQIMSTKYYARFGYILNPQYIHMSSDKEFTDVSHLLKRVINARHLTFLHNHPDAMRHRHLPAMVKDATYLRKLGTWAQDDALYEARKKRNFDL